MNTKPVPGIGVPNEVRDRKPRARIWTGPIIVFLGLTLGLSFVISLYAMLYVRMRDIKDVTEFKLGKAFSLFTLTGGDARTFHSSIAVMLMGVSQALWAIFLCPYNMSYGMATVVPLFNSLMNWLCLWSSYTQPESNHSLGLFGLIGFMLFYGGLILERLPEIQRMLWLRDPSHQGHLMTTGLASVAVHLNYTGDLMWRAGLVLMSGSTWLLLYPVLVLVFGFLPEIAAQRERHIKKHGAEFSSYYNATPKLIPGVW